MAAGSRDQASSRTRNVGRVARSDLHRPRERRRTEPANPTRRVAGRTDCRPVSDSTARRRTSGPAGIRPDASRSDRAAAANPTRRLALSPNRQLESDPTARALTGPPPRIRLDASTWLPAGGLAPTRRLDLAAHRRPKSDETADRATRPARQIRLDARSRRPTAPELPPPDSRRRRPPVQLRQDPFGWGVTPRRGKDQIESNHPSPHATTNIPLRSSSRRFPP